MKTYKNEVSTAFEILLEEIENVVEALNQESEKIFKCQDYEKAKILIEDASKITNFREKIKELQQQWKDIFAAKASKEWRISMNKKRKVIKS
jgi:excinuclease UvrABC nuclease subunit